MSGQTTSQNPVRLEEPSRNAENAPSSACFCTADIGNPPDTILEAPGWPLFVALASRNEVGKLKWMLTNGAYINVVDRAGWTALHHAAYHGHFEAVKFLVENRAELLSRSDAGESPEGLAASQGHHAIAEYIFTILCRVIMRDGPLPPLLQ